MAAAEADDWKKTRELMDGVYLPAPDASTAKIRDAQVRAAALAATRAGSAKSTPLDRGANLGLFEDVGGSDPDGGRLQCDRHRGARGGVPPRCWTCCPRPSASTECRDRGTG